MAAKQNPTIGRHMIVNGAFLVERDGVAAFEERVRVLADRSAGLTFRWTGPWPPWNFVDLHVAVDDAAAPR